MVPLSAWSIIFLLNSIGGNSMLDLTLNKPAIVYWIHFDEHKDPYTEGYVGVTVNLKQRLFHHKSQTKRLLDKLMSGAKIDILEECTTMEDALLVERKYRPTTLIGWNINKGGRCPPQGEKNYSSQKLTGKDRTIKQKRASAEHSKRMKGRAPGNKGKCMKLTIDGVEYANYKEAMAATGFSQTKVFRIGKR